MSGAKFSKIRPGYVPRVKVAQPYCPSVKVAQPYCPTALPSKPKYKNKKRTVDGIKFDSEKEARRWFELQLLVKAGRVCELQRQVVFELAKSVQLKGKKATPALRYVADFCYKEKVDISQPPPAFIQSGSYWRPVVEDSKGFRTPEYRIKRHLMLSVHGVEIRES